MKTPINFIIPKRSSRCVLCNYVFQQNDELISILQEEEEILRKDICKACSEPGTFLTKWKSRIKEKPVIEENVEDIQDSWQLLQKLHNSQDLQEQEEAFLLALFLGRKKVLHESKEKVKKDGQIWVLFEHEESGEAILVKQPDLKSLSVVDAQKRLKSRMKGELR